MDIGYGTSELFKLLKMIHEYFIEDINSWCSADVDGILFMDDWGSRQSLLIDPKMWREMFKPLYREYCNIIHSKGKYAFFHSDGFIEPVFGDFVEIGVDSINSQLFAMDIEDLGKKYKGKITFWGEMDRQHDLPFGTPEDIYKAVSRIKKSLDNGNGGVIAQCEWGKYNPIDNLEAVYDAWSKE